MTPAEALEQLLPRWKASLPASLSAELVDDFVRRHRRRLEELLGEVLCVRRIRRGSMPRSSADFTAVGLLAERERRRHAATDKDLAQDLTTRRAELAKAAKDADALKALTRRYEDYVLVRAEALLMRQMGWDAVPLRLRRPILAVFSAGSVVMAHRHGGDGDGSDEAILPGLHEASVADLCGDLEVAHEAATAIVRQIGDGPEAIWARARGRGAGLPRTATPLGALPPDQLRAFLETYFAPAALKELDALYALIAPEPVDRTGRMVHETRWSSRAAAIRQLERAGFQFIKGSRWRRSPRTEQEHETWALVKGATVQVTKALAEEAGR